MKLHVKTAMFDKGGCPAPMETAPGKKEVETLLFDQANPQTTQPSKAQEYVDWSLSEDNLNIFLGDEGAEVEGFQAIQDYKNLPQDEKLQGYAKEMTEFSQSFIDLYDVNQDGTMDINEYYQQQAQAYEKMFGEAMSASDEQLMQIFGAFYNQDLNGDEIISSDEMAAQFVYMDYDIEEGLDGKLDYASNMATDWTLPDIREILNMFHGYLYGTSEAQV